MRAINSPALLFTTLTVASLLGTACSDDDGALAAGGAGGGTTASSSAAGSTSSVGSSSVQSSSSAESSSSAASSSGGGAEGGGGASGTGGQAGTGGEGGIGDGGGGVSGTGGDGGGGGGTGGEGGAGGSEPIVPIDCEGGTVPVLQPTSGAISVDLFSDDDALVSPSSIAGNGDRRFWISDPRGNNPSGDCLQDVSPAGEATEVVIAQATAATCNVSQVTIDDAGNAYIFDTNLDILYRVTPAGAVSAFSTVGGIGGGGNCIDSGVIGVLVRDDGSFFVGSPMNDRIYTLSADGLTRAEHATVDEPLRLEHDGAGGLFAVSRDAIVHVSSTGVVTQHIDLTTLPDWASSGFGGPLRRDENGDLYFGFGARLYRAKDGSTALEEVAACFPGTIFDLTFDLASDESGSSIYVVTSSGSAETHDAGDRVFEIVR